MTTSLQTDLQEIYRAIKSYLKHPVQEIRKLPNWEWRRVILAQVIVTVICGFLTGLIFRSPLNMLMGMFVTPIIALLVAMISSLVFFYTFQIVSEKLIELRLIFTAVFFANVPFFLFQIIVGLFPPISLVGLAFTALLLIVAFVDNFQLSRKFVTRLIAGIYIVMVLTYVLAWYTSSHSAEHWHPVEESAPNVKLGDEPKAH